MKLPLTPSFSGLISNILSRAGGQLLYEQLEEAAKSATDGSTKNLKLSLF